MERPEGLPPLVPTGTRVGWRLPALAVVVLLAGLVALTRMGSTDQQHASTPTALPTAVAGVPVASASAGPIATAGGLAGGNAANRLTGVQRRSADGLTYADGIPTGISGEPVYRVRDTLLVPVGRTLLVGGWYLARDCRADGAAHCPSPTLSDVPLDPRVRDVSTTFVALNRPIIGTGAHVVLATIEPDPRCSISDDAGACQPRLRVLQQIWSG